jgi:hypothetical protein
MKYSIRFSKTYIGVLWLDLRWYILLWAVCFINTLWKFPFVRRFHKSPQLQKILDFLVHLNWFTEEKKVSINSTETGLFFAKELPHTVWPFLVTTFWKWTNCYLAIPVEKWKGRRSSCRQRNECVGRCTRWYLFKVVDEIIIIKLFNLPMKNSQRGV